MSYLRAPRDPRPASALSRRLSPSPEPCGEHVEFGAVGPAGLGLDMADDSEVALEPSEQFALGPALQHLGDEEPARREHFGGEVGGELDQADDAQMVGLAVAGGV